MSPESMPHASEQSIEEEFLFKKWKNQVKKLGTRESGSSVISDTHIALPSLLQKFKDYLAEKPNKEEKICDLFLLLLQKYPGSPVLREWRPKLFGEKSEERINTFLENMMDPTILNQDRKKY